MAQSLPNSAEELMSSSQMQAILSHRMWCWVSLVTVQAKLLLQNLLQIEEKAIILHP